MNRNEYQKQWASKNKEKVKAWGSRYDLNNKEKCYKNCLEWKKKNPEKSAEISRAAARRYRLNHPEKATRSRRAARESYRTRNIEIVNTAKLSGCLHCGELDPTCLDFHHRDRAGKLMTVSKLAAGYADTKLLLAEIAKCDLLCANCHRRHHAADGYKAYAKTHYALSGLDLDLNPIY